MFRVPETTSQSLVKEDSNEFSKVSAIYWPWGSHRLCLVPTYKLPFQSCNSIRATNSSLPFIFSTSVYLWNFRESGDVASKLMDQNAHNPTQPFLDGFKSICLSEESEKPDPSNSWLNSAAIFKLGLRAAWALCCQYKPCYCSTDGLQGNVQNPSWCQYTDVPSNEHQSLIWR